MTLPIGQLIDKQDGFEVVRDKIVEILAINAAEQETLAVSAAKDPDLFTFRVFEERSNPFEEWLNSPADTTARRPIVNVMYDAASFDQSGSDTVERQKCVATYHIDCYGYAVTANDVAGGHIPGDKAAILNVQRCARLVRNILMAGHYTYLDLRGTVWQRWMQSATMFQPSIDGRTVQNVVACRLSFSVTFNELSPQVTGEPLEIVGWTLTQAETGEILAEAEIDTTINGD